MGILLLAEVPGPDWESCFWQGFWDHDVSMLRGDIAALRSDMEGSMATLVELISEARWVGRPVPPGLAYSAGLSGNVRGASTRVGARRAEPSLESPASAKACKEARRDHSGRGALAHCRTVQFRRGDSASSQSATVQSPCVQSPCGVRSVRARSCVGALAGDGVGMGWAGRWLRRRPSGRRRRR